MNFNVTSVNMKIYFKAISILRLLRPLNCLIIFLSIFVSGIICSLHLPDFQVILIAAFTGALIGGAGNIINDYFDHEIDRINRPGRPIPSGKVIRSEALWIYIIINAAALMLSFYLGLVPFAISLIAVVLIFYYSKYFKKLLLWSNISVALLTSLAFIFGGSVSELPQQSIVPAVFAFVITLIREIVKDIQDIKGDSLNGIYTYPHRYGIITAAKTVAVLILLLMILAVLPYFLNIYNIEYFVFIMIVVNLIFLYILKILLKDLSETNINRISQLLKLNMVFGLLAIYIGVKV